MDQTTLNRGHLGFIEDKVRAAVLAFEAGELVECASIMSGIAAYIQIWLEDTGSAPK